MSIRTRLARSVVALVAIAVVIFGGLSFVVIDRALRSSFHAQLDTLVRAVAGAADVRDGRVSLDRNDMLAISTLHHGTPFALFDRDGRRVVGDPLPSAPERAGLAVATAPVARNGIVYGWATAWEPQEWIADFDRGIVIGTAAVGALLVLGGIMLSRRTADAVLFPLEAIAKLAERIEAYDLSSRLDCGGDDELGRICTSFNRMLDRLEAGFAQQRQFVADVSHELRTPLAVIKAEAELALRRERGAAAYREAIGSIAREVERLGGLTAQLLDVARAEADARDVRSVDVDGLVRCIVQRVRPAAEVRNVSVQVAANGAALARANAAIIERALLAIVHNAILHARESGFVEVHVAASPSAVRIAVADNGPGFTEDALAHATERFWRGEASRARGGTGLGLSIAKAMIESGGGAIELANAAEGGAVVTVSLPPAGP